MIFSSLSFSLYPIQFAAVVMNFYVVVVFENGLSNQMFVMPNGFKSRVELDSLEKDAEKTLKSMKNIESA